jgi:hypothetical protein
MQNATDDELAVLEEENPQNAQHSNFGAIIRSNSA